MVTTCKRGPHPSSDHPQGGLDAFLECDTIANRSIRNGITNRKDLIQKVNLFFSFHYSWDNLRVI